MYNKLLNVTQLHQSFFRYVQEVRESRIASDLQPTHHEERESRIASDRQPTPTVVKQTASPHLSPGAMTVAIIGLIVLLIITIVVLVYAYRRVRQIIEDKRKAKQVTELTIPQAFLEPVEFTIPTAPQMPHEMPRGYIHHIPPSVHCEKNASDSSSGRAPKLGVIGRSKSDKTHTSSKARERWSMLKRSYSDPCKGKKKIDSSIGAIDPDLYVGVADLHEFRQSKYGLGRLSFSLTHDKDIKLLTVNLIQATQLPGSLHTKNMDTFVKVSVLPEKDGEKKRVATSKVFRRSFNPRYNQTFVFRLEESDVPETVLRFVVFDHDRYSHPRVIGKAEYELLSHDFDVLESDNTIWRDLVEHPWEVELPPVDTNRGEILISLNYLPNAERINVAILKARNLRTSIIASAAWTGGAVATTVLSIEERLPPACPVPAADKTSLGIYTKVSIVKGGKQIKTKQTKVVRKDFNPVFNESFPLELRTDELDQTCLVITICLRVNQFKCHRVLGKCVIGGEIFCNGKPSDHWKEMLNNPRSSVAYWQTLV